MEKAGSKRSKRAPSFTAEEMATLVDEVWQHREVLFGGTRGKKDITVKKRIWQAIAQKMSPSSPGGLRDWCAVRKKWQEFQSQTKKKSAKARRESMGTGGGAPGGTTFTPDEEKVLSIIGKTASEGVMWGIDPLGDEELSENSEGEEEEPCGSGAATCTSPGEDDTPQPSPVPAHQPEGPGVRTRGRLRRPSIATCACSGTLVRLEREKLAVLRGIEGHLERQTALQEEMVRLKRQKLELHRRQLALAEAQCNSPSTSVPVNPPQDAELPQPHIFTEEEEVLSDQQLCDQKRNSSLYREDSDPPQIKEEHEELCISQEGEQLVLKLETDTFMLTPTYKGSDHSEPELESENRHVAESQDQKGGSQSIINTEPEPEKTHPKSRSQSIAVSKSNFRD